jgi:hypothetical protein
VGAEALSQGEGGLRLGTLFRASEHSVPACYGGRSPPHLIRMSGFLVVPFLLIGMVLMIFEKWNLGQFTFSFVQMEKFTLDVRIILTTDSTGTTRAKCSTLDQGYQLR